MGDKQRPNGAAAKAREVASATGGRRRGGKAATAAAPATRTARRSTRAAPATAVDDTMGYDLSRYEEIAPEPDRRDRSDSAAPDGPDLAEPDQPEPRWSEHQPALAGNSPGSVLPSPDDPDDPDDAGLTSVFRRFRRRGGRHRP
jgi:hypothetical protein